MKQMRNRSINPLSPHATRAALRPGFTLIELLVAMGIAVIVMAIIITGLAQALGGTERRSTQTTLNIARGMLGDFTSDSQNRNRLFRQILTSEGGFGSAVAIANPGLITNVTNSQNPVMDSSRRIQNLLLSKASSRQILESMPANQIEVDAATRLTHSQAARGGPSVQTTALLDAWRNPILFVPDGFETSAGLPTGTGGLAGVTAGGVAGTIRSPERKPYFVSAGADGSFLTGDDNIYSFEN